MMAVAAGLTRWKNRRLCYAATVQDFLAEPDAVRAPIFLDHCGHWQSLIAVHPTALLSRPPVSLPAPIEGPPFVC